MRIFAVLTLLLIQNAVFYGQSPKEDATPLLVKKNRFYAGVNLRPAFGFAMHERAFISDNIISPKIGYFLFNRLSLEVSGNGIGNRTAGPNKFPYVLNGEANLNYFPYAKKNILLYTIAGLSYNEFTQTKNGVWGTRPDLKLGTGVSFRFSKNPNFGINVEAAYYLNSRNFQFRQKMPTISVGITYSFPRKRSKPLPNADIQ